MREVGMWNFLAAVLSEAQTIRDTRRLGGIEIRRYARRTEVKKEKK